MTDDKTFSLQQLREFVFESKVKAYNLELSRTQMPDGTKIRRYENGPWIYEDETCGYHSFIDREIVWFKKEPKWGMNSAGIKVKNIDTEILWQFLLPAIKYISKERPFIGPSYFKEDGFEYIEKSKGDIDNFEGKGRVLQQGKVVFIAPFHGGLIEKR